jgi:excisionase family DNA binding protein
MAAAKSKAAKPQAAKTIDPSQRLTWSIEEAAELLGVSRAVAYVYAQDGKLPTIKLGGRILVPKLALERMVNGT